MAKKQALYHRSGWEPKPLFVIKENKSAKTLDLGDAEGTVLVSDCPLRDEPENGCCTRGATKPKPKDPKEEGKKPDSKEGGESAESDGEPTGGPDPAAAAKDPTPEPQK